MLTCSYLYMCMVVMYVMHLQRTESRYSGQAQLSLANTCGKQPKLLGSAHISRLVVKNDRTYARKNGALPSISPMSQPNLNAFSGACLFRELSKLKVPHSSHCCRQCAIHGSTEMPAESSLTGQRYLLQSSRLR